MTTITDGAFLHAAQQILMEDMRRITIERIARIIYDDAMTQRRPAEEAEELFKAFRIYTQEYFETLKSLQFRVPFELHPNGMWYSVSYPGDAITRPQFGIFKALHKEYFTFLPISSDPRAIHEEIKRFLNALPVLHQALNQVNFSIRPSCGISIKLPTSLYYFFTHPDSLVIHYRDPRVGNSIRSIVATVYHDAGVQLQRSLRAHSGFDFYFEHDGEEKGLSHSQLISRIVAHHISKNREGLMRYQPQ